MLISISRSFGRKLLATTIVATGLVLMYESKVIDFRDIPLPLESVDGVVDSLTEKFALDLTSLAPGEHLLVLRAADSANNSGLARVVLK